MKALGAAVVVLLVVELPCHAFTVSPPNSRLTWKLHPSSTTVTTSFAASGSLASKTTTTTTTLWGKSSEEDQEDNSNTTVSNFVEQLRDRLGHWFPPKNTTNEPKSEPDRANFFAHDLLNRLGQVFSRPSSKDEKVTSNRDQAANPAHHLLTTLLEKSSEEDQADNSNTTVSNFVEQLRDRLGRWFSAKNTTNGEPKSEPDNEANFFAHGLLYRLGQIFSRPSSRDEKVISDRDQAANSAHHFLNRIVHLGTPSEDDKKDNSNTTVSNFEEQLRDRLGLWFPPKNTTNGEPKSEPDKAHFFARDLLNRFWQIFSRPSSKDEKVTSNRDQATNSAHHFLDRIGHLRESSEDDQKDN